MRANFATSDFFVNLCKKMYIKKNVEIEYFTGE